MALPAPDLDDRRFQELVDEAKRLVMRRCPEWTDHNVSDPGVTLIETFAYMTDQLLYRLNRIPDRLHIAFLDLIGLRMLPPTPARAGVTFWLSSPGRTTLTVNAGTQVATLHTPAVEPIVFSTVDALAIVPCSLVHVRTPATESDEEDGETAAGSGGAGQGGGIGLDGDLGRLTADRMADLGLGRAFPAFAPHPRIDDVLLLGLSGPVPGCAVRVDFRGSVHGVGVNPKHPPLVWEAWTGDWTGCEVELDSTGGLNTAGQIIVHVPSGHDASVIGGDRAGWIRAKVVEPEEGQPPYTDSPVVESLVACTIGGTAEAINAEVVQSETLGEAEGVPGQEFSVRRRPVLGGYDSPIVETSSDDGWEGWTEVEHFSESGPQDRHFALDAVSGLVLFGPAVRETDGSLRQYGRVPDKDAVVRIRRYATGGGGRGNVAAGAISTLKSSVPFVGRVENRHPAQGGVDGETLEEARRRGPLLVRTRWWHRFRPRRGPKTVKIGTAQGKNAKGSNLHHPGFSLRHWVGQVYRKGRIVVAVVILAAGTVYGVYPPFRTKVNSIFTTEKSKFSNIIDQKFVPIHAIKCTATAQLKGHPAALACDGFFNNYWLARWKPSPEPALTLTFSHPVTITRMILHNGAFGRYVQDGRPSLLHLVFSNGESFTITPQDTPQAQTFTIKHAVLIKSIVIQVPATYQGTVGQNVAISQIELFGIQ